MAKISPFILVFVFLLLPSKPSEARSTFDKDATRYAVDFKHIFSSPAHFSNSQWLTTAAILGTTASAFLIDEPIRDFAQENHSRFLDGIMPYGDYYGRFLTTTGLSTLVYISGIAFDDEETRLTGRAMIEALSFSLMISGSMKVIFGRSRPYMNQGNMQFNWFETSQDMRSFPSGHSTSAFAISSVLSERIRRPWATVGLYGLATLTLLNRMYDDMHWLSDTLMGAAIGTTIGIAVGKRVNKEAEHRSRFNEPIAPLEFWTLRISF